MRNSNQALAHAERTSGHIQQLERVQPSAVARLSGANEAASESESWAATAAITALTALLAGGLVWQLATALQVPSVF